MNSLNTVVGVPLYFCKRVEAAMQSISTLLEIVKEKKTKRESGNVNERE